MPVRANNHYKEWCLTVKRYRLERLWSMVQMARATRVSISTLHQIEKGRKVSDLSIAKIGAALPDIKVEEVLYERG